MVVHIAAIGTETGHVTEWFRDGSVEKIYLIHSRKTADDDFPKKARDLAKKIKRIVGVIHQNFLFRTCFFANFWRKLFFSFFFN